MSASENSREKYRTRHLTPAKGTVDVAEASAEPAKFRRAKALALAFSVLENDRADGKLIVKRDMVVAFRRALREAGFPSGTHYEVAAWEMDVLLKKLGGVQAVRENVGPECAALPEIREAFSATVESIQKDARRRNAKTLDMRPQFRAEAARIAAADEAKKRIEQAQVRIAARDEAPSTPSRRALAKTLKLPPEEVARNVKRVLQERQGRRVIVPRDY